MLANIGNSGKRNNASMDEYSVLFTDILFPFLAFRKQENNVRPNMPEDCANMKLGHIDTSL